MRPLAGIEVPVLQERFWAQFRHARLHALQQRLAYVRLAPRREPAYESTVGAPCDNHPSRSCGLRPEEGAANKAQSGISQEREQRDHGKREEPP